MKLPSWISDRSARAIEVKRIAGSLSLSHVHYLAGLTALRLNSPGDAMEHFVASSTARPQASATMKMAALMATGGHYAEALELSGLALQQIDENPAGALSNVNVIESSIHEFRRVVGEELEKAD